LNQKTENISNFKPFTKKSNFLYSYFFLPAWKIDAITTVYAFCRKSDDIVDEEKPVEEKLLLLSKWRDEFQKSLKGESTSDLFRNLNATMSRFKIPEEPFIQLLDGMEMDIVKSRYSDFSELREYCYKVASTVGLISIEIFGYKNEKTKLFAENLGIALQLTNIIRDVKRDVLQNRIYIPREDMKKFGYEEEDFVNNVYDDRFRKLMDFECSRAKEYYELANKYLTKEDKGLMFSARIMQHIYFSLLRKIEHLDYNVYKTKVRISKFRKFLIAYGVFLKYKILYNIKDTRISPAGCSD
jgi:phytoene synthase